MAKAVQLHDVPRCKQGLPEYPKFVIRTETVQYGRTRKWKALWDCRCGTRFEAQVDSVVRRDTKSCGCIREEKSHGHTIGGIRSPTYVTWQSMIGRCTNPNHDQYAHYAGLGVKVCDQWLTSFQQFLDDVGERPRCMTLDRIDPHGDYEPLNVRWASPMTQRHNRRSK